MTPEQYGLGWERRFGATVRFLRARGANLDAAREAAQAGSARCFEKLGQLRNESSLLPWITTTAMNHYRDSARRGGRFDQLRADFDLAGSQRLSLVAIEVKIALDRVRPDQKQLLEWAYIHGFTCEEISLKLGKSACAVYSALSRARRAFRIQMGCSAQQDGVRRITKDRRGSGHDFG